MDDKPSYELSHEGLDRLQAWERAVARREELTRELARAETDAANAETHLGRWMIPAKGASLGEKFHIWLGNGLLEASQVQEGRYVVRWRQPQTGKSAMNALR